MTVAEAHHSFAMFDREQEIVKTGTVVRWAFNNPHSWLYLNVKNEDGSETLWSFEGSAPPSLVQRGITGATFEPGDTRDVHVLPVARRPPRRRDRLGAGSRTGSTSTRPTAAAPATSRASSAGKAGSRRATRRRPKPRRRSSPLATQSRSPANRRRPLRPAPLQRCRLRGQLGAIPAFRPPFQNFQR